MNLQLRFSLLLGALVCGGTASALPGCLAPDYCIFISSPGEDWCRGMAGAVMWPAGQPDLAVPIKDEQIGDPAGCRCMNSAERDILMSQSPAAEYIDLSGELAIAARQDCVSLVPEGFEHNCMTLEGPNASTVEEPVAGAKSNECIGDCAYANPPPFKDCPSPDPYECNDQPSPGGDDEAGTSEDTTDEGGVILSDLPRAP